MEIKEKKEKVKKEPKEKVRHIYFIFWETATFKTFNVQTAGITFNLQCF